MNFLWLKEDPVKNLDQALVRAHLGETYLDEKFGPDWDQLIDVDRLNIKSPINCVLSQLMRQGHLSLLFLSLQEAVNYGFSCGMVDASFWIPFPAVNRSFRRLTHAWKLILRERRCQAKSVDTKRQTCDAECAMPVAAASHNVNMPINDCTIQHDSLAVAELSPALQPSGRDNTSGIVGVGLMWKESSPTRHRTASERGSCSDSTRPGQFGGNGESLDFTDGVGRVSSGDNVVMPLV